jgi:uncharacterized membrane protein
VTPSLVAVPLPSGPAFTVVLILHVAAVLAGSVAVVSGVVAAARVLRHRPDAPLPATVRSYFAPGFNWMGRALYLVPVVGAGLLAMSGGAYRVGDAWVLFGLGMWAAAMVTAEWGLWGAERRVQRGLEGWEPPAPLPGAVVGACKTMCVSGAAVMALVLAAVAVMVAKP